MKTGKYFREMLEVLAGRLNNERGEVGDKEEPEEGLSPEELAVMEGKDPEESEEPEPEKKDEKPEATGDPVDPEDSEKGDTKAEIRIGELDGLRKTAEEKLDLLKSDPDAYYVQYPTEAPKKEEPEPVAHREDVGSLVYQNPENPNDPHIGKTLRELYDDDPVLATSIQTNYEKAQRDEAAAKETSAATAQEEAQNAVISFSKNLTRSLFDKEIASVDELSEEEWEKVNGVITEVNDFMTKTKRGGGNLEDAYWLMNRDAELQKAKADGAGAVVDRLRTGSIPSVSTGGDGGKATGFESFEQMSRDELGEAIEGMSIEQIKILNDKAPESLRKKFPDIFD